jgi:hypothetical protein
VSEVAAAESFDGVQPVGVRMARVVEPGLVVESDGFDDKRVAVPLADGVGNGAIARPPEGSLEARAESTWTLHPLNGNRVYMSVP